MINLKKLLFLATVIFCLTITYQNALAQNYPDQNLLNQAEQISGDVFIIQKKTSKGAIVYSTKTPSKEFLEAVDKGLTELFAVARKNDYFSKLNFSL